MNWLDQLKNHQRNSVSFVSTSPRPFLDILYEEREKLCSERKKRSGRGLPKLTKLSFVALEWVREHREELCKAGWTAAELYRRNKSRGVLWLTVWSTPDVEVSLQPDGAIQFKIDNRGVTLAARPKAHNLSRRES